jgi:hypothetical protein
VDQARLGPLAGGWAGVRARAGAWLGGLHWADVAAGIGLAALAAFYFWRLDAYRMNDDEGGYLYAAWRISQGELPYRDFLTPQLPAFLLPGGLVVRLFGPEVWPLRALAVLLALGAGVATWATARRLFGPPVALIAGAALLLQPDVYEFSRMFRAEAFMLFLTTLGVYLFARGAFPRRAAEEPPRRRWLAAAGVAFGLASVAKLFGLLPLAGCLAWLVADGWWRRRPSRAVVKDGLAVLLPAGAVVAAVMAAFAAASPQVYEAVLGHHLRQGRELGLGQVLQRGLDFYLLFLRQNGHAVLVFVAAAVAATAWRVRDRRALLLGWQLPTVLAFLVLSREKYARHLVYLVPALATLFALGCWGLIEASAAPVRGRGQRLGAAGQRWIAVALVLALVVPWQILDRDKGFSWEVGTQRLGDFIELVTPADDGVLSDYAGVNFYGRRPTTYAAAGLSAGATRSGQITWERLAAELAGRLPRLLVIDTDRQFAHLRFLRDRPAFDAWIAAHYGPPAGTFSRDSQLYEVYAPKDRPLPVQARFAGGPTLLAAAPRPARATAGDTVAVRSAWRGEQPTDGELAMTVRLVDAGGTEWAQADGLLAASDGTDDLKVRPTSRWRAGELTADQVALTLPPGLPPGDYELLLGLYRRDPVQPLEVVDAQGTSLGANAPAGRLHVVPWQPSPAETRRLPLDLRADAPASDGLRLLGRGPLPQAPVLAGTTWPLELWWQAEGVTADRAVRVTLSDPAVGSVAADWTVPLGVPGTPSSAWPPEGLVVGQPLQVPVLASADGGRYELAVTVVAGAGGGAGAGGAPSADALPAPPIRLGGVAVTARDLATVLTHVPPVSHPLEATVGGTAELVGADVAAQAAPGEALPVTLVWRALAPAATAQKVTVQLLDAGGRPVAQHDSEPAGWTRPTTGWLPEEVIPDEHVLHLPADLAAGSYRLVAAMYHPGTGARLPAGGRDATPAGDAVRVATVEVR